MSPSPASPAFVPLEGRFVRLEPYAPALRDEVAAALDCDEQAWALMSTSGGGARFDAWWEGALREQAAGQRMAYAIRDLDSGAIAGTSSYLTLRPASRGLEIGATFLRPEFRGGPVNPQSKLLMLAHAFGAGMIRVELVTDLRNLRSQAAIAKLGAVREGVLRRHKITFTGHLRDTVMFSITDLEWPTVRAGLEARLAGF